VPLDLGVPEIKAVELGQLINGSETGVSNRQVAEVERPQVIETLQVNKPRIRDRRW
jgi:hypothetical protein